MKTIAFFYNSRIPGVIVLWFGCVLVANAVRGQSRNPDLILTVRKDTLSVKIVEVGISDVSYRELTGDTTALRTIAKSDVLRIFYGNGDEEEFKSPASVQTVKPDRRYYKMVVKTPFQKEIAEWSTEKLLVKKELYRQKYMPQKVAGIIAFPVGGALAVVGICQAIVSIFDSDVPNGAAAFTSGVVIATGIGIPLTVFGSKNKKKYRAIETELEVRGVLTD